MQRNGHNWQLGAGESESLDEAMARAGHVPAPLPGIEDSDRLIGVRDVQVSSVPISLTPQLRQLSLTPGEQRVDVERSCCRTSLAVLPQTVTTDLTGERAARLMWAEYTIAVTFGDEGVVTHYPGLAQRVA